MKTQVYQPGRFRRTINDLVMAEMFMLQATIESAAAIGDGISTISRELTGDEGESRSWESISSTLQRTADSAIEPYATRFRYLRDLPEEQ